MSLVDILLIIIGTVSLISSLSYIFLNSNQLTDLLNKNFEHSYFILFISLVNQLFLILISCFLIQLIFTFKPLLYQYLIYLCLISIFARLVQLNIIYFTGTITSKVGFSNLNIFKHFLFSFD